MGNSQSDRKVQGDSEEGGFHLFELHMPSVGTSIISIVFILLVMALCACAYKHFYRQARNGMRNVRDAIHGRRLRGFSRAGSVRRYTPPPELQRALQRRHSDFLRYSSIRPTSPLRPEPRTSTPIHRNREDVDWEEIKRRMDEQ